MDTKINFTGLKGLSSPENKKNLGLLNKIYGENFIDAAKIAFSKIDEISQDKDVFLHTAVKEGFAKDYMVFSVADSSQKEIASSSFKMGSKPEKYSNTPGLRKALLSLRESFERNFVTDEQSDELNHLIDRYS